MANTNLESFRWLDPLEQLLASAAAEHIGMRYHTFLRHAVLATSQQILDEVIEDTDVDWQLCYAAHSCTITKMSRSPAEPSLCFLGRAGWSKRAGRCALRGHDPINVNVPPLLFTSTPSMRWPLRKNSTRWVVPGAGRHPMRGTLRPGREATGIVR